jgi:hypothetical protein
LPAGQADIDVVADFATTRPGALTAIAMAAITLSVKLGIGERVRA